jgi:hypothetical protein
MSITRKTLIASFIGGGLAASAFALPANAEGGEGWAMHERMLYAVDMAGHLDSFKMTDKAKGMTGRAHRVPKGTVFFMKDGSLYMMQMNGPNFDRAVGRAGGA